MVEGYTGKTEKEAAEIMAYNGWRVQLNIGKLPTYTIIQTFWNSLFQSISHLQ